MAYRDNTKVIKIGDRVIGGGNPILIQSMTNTRNYLRVQTNKSLIPDLLLYPDTGFRIPPLPSDELFSVNISLSK